METVKEDSSLALRFKTTTKDPSMQELLNKVSELEYKLVKADKELEQKAIMEKEKVGSSLQDPYN